MEILLTRHGQTEWNVLRKVQGKVDIELNTTGIKQAEETAVKLKNTDIEFTHKLILQKTRIPLKTVLKLAFKNIGKK